MIEEEKKNFEDIQEEKKNFEDLILASSSFMKLKDDCRIAVKLSLTGITNLVVNYEDPHLVSSFLKVCYQSSELYKETFDIDAVELQKGRPGQGFAAQYLDILIHGSYAAESVVDSLTGLESKVPTIDPQTGSRERNQDGFSNRREVFTNDFEDKVLIINNLDYCMDFCQDIPGIVDSRSLWIFDHFRNPTVKQRCQILLVTNKPIKFPFKVRTLHFESVDEFEGQHILACFANLYRRKEYHVDLTESQEKQIVRKLCGLTYTEAGDALAEAFSNKSLIVKKGKKGIDSAVVVNNLRNKINSNFMQDAVGLTHLRSKPWEDYIRSESSNFTWDVRKIVRDFEEIDRLKKILLSLSNKGKPVEIIEKSIKAIRARIPHVILLYGRGGVGKSAFPVHFAGLLDFDVWDFNINAAHNMYVGKSAENMREALKRITQSSHLVIRIDEYDRAMGSTQAGGAEMHAAHKQVESEFMNWLQNVQEDNLLVDKDIFLVLTTNHKENITGPLKRSGRIDLVIDISEFDQKSIKESFLSAPRRMEHRGVDVIQMDCIEKFNDAISQLDLDKISQIAAHKGFTVRDVDMFLQEMAAHDYYFKQGKQGFPWRTESFIVVLENSVGSAKHEETAELVLGDRNLLDVVPDKKNDQMVFPFYNDCFVDFDYEAFIKSDFFRQS